MKAKKIYKIRTTLIEMLTDRGYNVAPNVSFDMFLAMYENKNYDIIDDDKTIYAAFFTGIKSFGKKDLETLVMTVKSNYGDDIKIIVVVKEINKIIEKEVQTQEYKNVEIFSYDELVINITRHRLVSKHIPLNEEEAKEVVEKYGSVKHIPLLLMKDPIRRYYAMPPGTVCKIIRASPTEGESISYRLVR